MGGGGSGLEGSGWGGGVRVDVNRSEVFVKIQNKIGGSGRGVFGGGGGGGQGGCERRIEVFVKIQKKNCGGSGRGVGGIRLDVNEELKLFEKIKNKLGGRIGGGGVGSGWGIGFGGVRVDVNEELKFL